ncbi:hypothetical protein BHE74_00009081 [Ensete ventricosum]|nr:hypothetical protein BHE74_00009081 [Ensete ventricosum]
MTTYLFLREVLTGTSSLSVAPHPTFQASPRHREGKGVSNYLGCEISNPGDDGSRPRRTGPQDSCDCLMSGILLRPSPTSPATPPPPPLPQKGTLQSCTHPFLALYDSPTSPNKCRHTPPYMIKTIMDQRSNMTMRRLGKPFLWISAISFALVSVLLSFNTFPPPATVPSETTGGGLLGNVVSSVLSPSSAFIDNVVCLIEQVLRRGHHHRHRRQHHRRRRRRACDISKWVSPLALEQNATLILTVDQKGCANFSSVQKAIDAVPDYSPNRTLIILDSGVYRFLLHATSPTFLLVDCDSDIRWRCGREKVFVWANKTNITMQGQGFLNTSIAWNDTANSTGGTIYSASVSVFSFNFIAYNISFQASSPPSNDLVLLLATLFLIIHGLVQNTAPAASPGDVGAQAVALRIAGDQAALYGCGFYGAQDTLLDDRGRHYFRECFIEGSIDFIFGNARSLYEVRRTALRPQFGR